MGTHHFLENIDVASDIRVANLVNQPPTIYEQSHDPAEQLGILRDRTKQYLQRLHLTQSVDRMATDPLQLRAIDALVRNEASMTAFEPGRMVAVTGEGVYVAQQPELDKSPLLRQINGRSFVTGIIADYIETAAMPKRKAVRAHDHFEPELESYRLNSFVPTLRLASAIAFLKVTAKSISARSYPNGVSVPLYSKTRITFDAGGAVAALRSRVSPDPRLLRIKESLGIVKGINEHVPNIADFLLTLERIVINPKELEQNLTHTQET